MTIYGTGSVVLVIISSIIIIMLLIKETFNHKLSNLIKLFKRGSH
jgi:hypothetical protein